MPNEKESQSEPPAFVDSMFDIFVIYTVSLEMFQIFQICFSFLPILTRRLFLAVSKSIKNPLLALVETDCAAISG